MISYCENLKKIEGKKIILRLDLNVPIYGNQIRDDYRIKRILPTLEFLRKKGAKVLIISHIENKGESLLPIVEGLKSYFNFQFGGDILDPALKDRLVNIVSGGVILTENIRRHKEEKEGDQKFAQMISRLGDIYINDAFSASHRDHASIVAITKFLPSYAGILFKAEIDNLSKAFKPTNPFLFILGGNKLETKIPLIKKFFDLADSLFIGGVPANNFLKEKGMNIGASIFSNAALDIKKYVNSSKIILPQDVIISNEKGRAEKDVKKVDNRDKILDAGPNTLKNLEKIIKKSKMVVWNGPLGNYEIGFKEGTLTLAKIIANSKTLSIIGGGDTLAAIKELDLYDKFTFVSTGGGAMLQFLATGTLPGIDALLHAKS